MKRDVGWWFREGDESDAMIDDRNGCKVRSHTGKHTAPI
jgi:hypothetical protein